MSILAEQRTEVTLGARISEFQRVLESMQVTDSRGARHHPETALAALVQALQQLGARGGSLFLIGNGGSASVASHAVTDFLKFGGLRAMTLHDPSLLTCMANDYGYDVAFARVLGKLASTGDVLIAVSSSGQSLNIRNAAEEMRSLGGVVWTLSGFRADNPLRDLGDINVWLDSSDYGMVEIGHQFVLHNLADRMRLKGEE
jgi:D-sedoheptulose 7-phosphate isomerase